MPGITITRAVTDRPKPKAAGAAFDPLRLRLRLQARAAGDRLQYYWLASPGASSGPAPASPGVSVGGDTTPSEGAAAGAPMSTSASSGTSVRGVWGAGTSMSVLPPIPRPSLPGSAVTSTQAISRIATVARRATPHPRPPELRRAVRRPSRSATNSSRVPYYGKSSLADFACRQCALRILCHPPAPDRGGWYRLRDVHPSRRSACRFPAVPRLDPAPSCPQAPPATAAREPSEEMII